MRLLMPILVVSLTAVGCNYGKRNVAACEDWIVDMDEKVSQSACANTDVASLLQGGCDNYESSSCDISDYFDCLYDNTECNENSGEINAEGWADCNALLACE